MSSGMGSLMGRPLGGPVSTVSEGGIQAGAMSIQSLNTTVLMQMYENTSKMWGNIVNFGTEMTNLSYKWLKYEYDKEKALVKAQMEAEELEETKAQSRIARENNELMKKYVEIEANRQRGGLEAPKDTEYYGSEEGQMGPPEPVDAEATVELKARPANYVELPEREEEEDGSTGPTDL